ncbi:MAG: lipopolysaccharide biosynthesis protein [Hyphomonas sp.]|nr:lipopolysaccharide biosynthesis protein [Hyphomonas sp.]
MPLSRKLLTSSIYVMLGTGANGLAGLLVFVILARLLDPASIGLVALAIIFIEISRMIAFSGLPEAIVQRPEWDHAVSSTCFSANILAAVVLSLVCAGAVAPLTSIYVHPDAGPVLAALSGVLLIDSARVIHEAKLKREFRFKALAMRATIATLISGGVGIWMAFSGFGVWALVAQRMLSSTIMTALTWFAAKWRPSPTLSWPILKSLSNFMLQLAPARILMACGLKAPDLVIGFFLGPAALGFYRIGLKGVDTINQFAINPMREAALSALSRLPDAAAIGKAYVRATRVIAFVACPILFGVAAVSPDLVLLVFGPHWGASGWIMTVLALGGAGIVLAHFLQPAFTAAGRTGLVLSTSLYGFVAVTVLCLIAAPFGLLAVAIANALRGYASIPFWLTLLSRNLHVSPREVLMSVLPAWLAAAGMAAGVAALRWLVVDDAALGMRLLACVTLGAVLYPVLLLLFGRAYLVTIRTEIVPLLPQRIRIRLFP